MNLQPGPEQLKMQNVAREFATNTLRNTATELEKNHQFPLEQLAEMANLGLMGVNIDTKYGGSAAGVVGYSLAVSEIAMADPAVAVTMCVNNMVAEVLAEFGEGEQLDHIAEITSGRYPAGSFCLSEPGSGSDAASMQTRAVPNDDGYVLNGTKAWITSGEFAGVYIVWATVGDGGRETISAFVVDPKSDGISWGKPEEKMGQHASNTVQLSFDDVQIPKHSLLAEVGHGFKIAMMALDGGRVGIGSQALGIAKEAINVLRQSGHGQAAERLADDVRAAELLVWRAAWLKQQKRPFTKEASMAKLYASEAACRVCEAAISEMGYSATLPAQKLEKLLRDGRVTRIYEGTSEVQRIVISREVMKVSA